MQKETLKEHAYYYIKNKIINCEYQPGMLLNEEMLKDDVKASRTPIRDAISRLEQENLVRILPKKGILVSELSIREINTIYESRMMLEPYVIQNYANRIPEEKYLKYLKIFSNAIAEELYSSELYEADTEFHEMLVDASENHYLIVMYNHIASQNKRLRILSGVKSEIRLRETQEEHLRIIEKCLGRDWESAAKYMKKHLVNSRKAALDVALKNDNFSM